jgi:Fe-S-cluster containining protein
MPSTEGEPRPADEEALPECTECGACCFSQLHTYVAVSGTDYARIGEGAEHWVDFDGHKAHLKMHAGHCAALRIAPASAPLLRAGDEPHAVNLAPGGTLGHFTCDIYPLRPETCRTLERGSPMCRAERAHKRSRALVAASVLIRER